MGLAALSEVRRYADLSLGHLHPSPLESRGSRDSHRPASLVLPLPEQLLRGVGLARSAELVQPRGPSIQPRSVVRLRRSRSSLRRTAEFTRSLLGRQERWSFWRPLDAERDSTEECRLGASTVHRWLDVAGQAAKKTVKGQLAGVRSSGQVSADGLWAKLRGGVKRVVLVLVDSASGLVYPPVVVEGEESEKSWQKLFARAKRAGLPIGPA